MTPDPMGGDITNPQSLNRYAYVLNNPTTLTDPSGLNQDCTWDPVTQTLTCYLSGGGDDGIVGPGGCAGMYVNGAYVGSTCGKGTGNQGGRQNGGAGVGGSGIKITNASQAGPQQKTIGNALSKLLVALACDQDCTSFLASKGLDPVETLRSIIDVGIFGHADISLAGNPYAIGAVSGGVAGQAITANNNGAFFSGSAPGGLTFSVGPHHIPGGTPQAQAFILLHELGHNTGVLRPDAGVPKAGMQNDRDIQAHCEKTLGQFK